MSATLLAMRRASSILFEQQKRWLAIKKKIPPVGRAGDDVYLVTLQNSTVMRSDMSQCGLKMRPMRSSKCNRWRLIQA